VRYYIVIEYDEDSGEPDERYIVVKSDNYDMMKDYHYRCYYIMCSISPIILTKMVNIKSGNW